VTHLRFEKRAVAEPAAGVKEAVKEAVSRQAESDVILSGALFCRLLCSER
jgi:hypothetical protein